MKDEGGEGRMRGEEEDKEIEEEKEKRGHMEDKS